MLYSPAEEQPKDPSPEEMTEVQAIFLILFYPHLIKDKKKMFRFCYRVLNVTCLVEDDRHVKSCKIRTV